MHEQPNERPTDRPPYGSRVKARRKFFSLPRGPPLPLARLKHVARISETECQIDPSTAMYGDSAGEVPSSLLQSARREVALREV